MTITSQDLSTILPLHVALAKARKGGERGE